MDLFISFEYFPLLIIKTDFDFKSVVNQLKWYESTDLTTVFKITQFTSIFFFKEILLV